MPTPTCPANCDFTLPVVQFDNCAPLVVYSEICRIFLAKKAAAPFTNWLSATEWLARMSQSSTTGNDYIRPLTVIGDKPAAADIIKEISNGRKIVIGKDHTINFTIDELSQANYDFMRGLECGGEFKLWYETEGGYIYGGNEGITVRLTLNDVLNRGREEIETLVGVITWRSKFSPERGISPIYSGATVPTTFDTTLDFTSATTDTAAGVSGTVLATDPDQLFEFNAISPAIGTPQSMSIEVSSVEEITIDFTTDYTGQYFKYTDKAGVEHTGQFANGTVSF
jgi:hypothetical protein